jgi:L-alanine-DL-glutamate epimerase-like enolase superfamily enzyme
MLVTTGEHEATRWGFRQLIEMRCADIIEPDVGWCGGITELLKISALADAHGVMVIPHGSSVYSYHFVVTRTNSPFAEFLMMHPTAEDVVPMFSPMLLDEPLPVNGRMTVPGWIQQHLDLVDRQSDQASHVHQPRGNKGDSRGGDRVSPLCCHHRGREHNRS